MKRNAIIIAAGTSSRFVPLSFEKPKGLLEVRGEVLIERQIRQLHEAGISDITVVVGYKADAFLYLKDKYYVDFVINNDYLKYNNTSSLVRVIDRLNNTYICCSDQYYAHNPFIKVLKDSSYAALFADKNTAEYCLKLDDADYIKAVHIGGDKAWYMAGFAFFTQEFSNIYKKILLEEYNNENIRHEYWEDLYIKHLCELPLMKAVRFKEGELCEFDSLDELRMFDKSYITDTRSTIIKEICCLLNCHDEDLSKFRKATCVDGYAFIFDFDKQQYLYNNGNVKLC